MKISSQRFLDQNIVNAKIAASDFVVMTATIIDDDGEEYAVIIDGHHSFEAAKQTGNEPVFEESDYNYQSEVEFIGFDDWMEQHWIDSEWYNIETDGLVW